MMKKHITVLAAACLLPIAAHAKVPYGMAGCGLGSVVFSPDSMQVFASTTNGTFFNQPFAISMGSLNCLEPSKAAALNAQEQFISMNYSNLKEDIAKGDGETLKAFSNTFGCTKDSYEAFATQLQGSYSKIFASQGPMAALGEVEDVVKNNPSLSSSCALAI